MLQKRQFDFGHLFENSAKINFLKNDWTKVEVGVKRQNEDFCSLCDFTELKIRDIEADLQPEKTITSRVRDIIRDDDLLCELEHYDQKIKKSKIQISQFAQWAITCSAIQIWTRNFQVPKIRRPNIITWNKKWSKSQKSSKI